MRNRLFGLLVPLALLAFLALVTRSSPAAAQSGATWRMVGQIGGPTQAVAVQGHYAYIGVGLRLVVLDISDPANLTEVGSTAPFPYFVEGVVVSGTLAYVAAGGAGLRVVDVLNPADPTELGAWDSPGYAEGVAVAGNMAYLADGPYGLRAVDVSNPGQPMPLGSAYDANYAFAVVLSGNFAYIAGGGAGLLIVDVSDARQLREIASLDTPGYARAVALQGRLAYVADEWEGIQVVDVSDPAKPHLVSAIQTPGWAFGLTISGTCAYVADAFAGLQMLDISDHSNPEELGSYRLWRGHVGSVAVDRSLAYVADRTWGLRVIDVSEPAALHEVGAYSPMGFAGALTLAAPYVYVAGAGHGLRIVDVSDMAHPGEVGAAALPDPNDTSAPSVGVLDNYAYVGVGGWLYVADISNPAQPVWTHRIAMNEVWDIAVAGAMAYVADANRLQVVDCSNPAQPVLRGGLVGRAERVVVSGTLAYLASGQVGLSVADVSNPDEPLLLGSAPIFAVDVDVAGSWAYVVDRGGLSVVDVSRPDAPRKVSFLETEGVAVAVIVSGSTAYVADSGRGVSVIDVSDPYRPLLVAEANTAGCSLDLILAADRLLVADGSSGLVVLQSTASDVGTLSTVRGWARPLYSATIAVPPRRTASPESAQMGVTSTLVVTSPLDSGPGTLRQALLSAATGDRIIFDPAFFAPVDPVTIVLRSDLPPITQGRLTLDGSDAGVIVDGSNIPPQTTWPYAYAQGGLILLSDGNRVSGLQLVNFPGSGVLVQGDANVIGGDRSRGRGPVGQGNVISGNGIHGIYVNGRYDNVVVGNLLGTDVTGRRAFGNRSAGVGISGMGSDNRIGGTEAKDRNILSGNGYAGVQLHNCSGNTVVGNYVGTDIDGSAGLGNGGYGVTVEVGSFGNLVQANVCSGNGSFSILVSNWGSSYNTVIGNLIGTDASGMSAIPDSEGILVGDGASFNRIGGYGPGEANLVSGNKSSGIALEAGAGPGNLVVGNLVGTTISGNAPLGNAILSNSSGGISLRTCDGVTLVEGNLVSGNDGRGILLAGDYGFAIRNTLGTDPTRSGSLPNAGAGFHVRGEHNLLQNNWIANSLTGPGIEVYRWPYNAIRRNSVSGNARRGIELTGGGNAHLAAPVIIGIDPMSVSGTACPGCTVEVFSDDEDEGRIYEGTTVADASGRFAFAKGSGLMGPYITATATDADGNTSEFSLPARLVVGRVWLPVLWKQGS